MKNELFDISEKNIKILCDSNLFNKDILIGLWKEFLEIGNNSTLLWALVVFGSWLKNNKINHL